MSTEMVYPMPVINLVQAPKIFKPFLALLKCNENCQTVSNDHQSPAV